MTLLETALSIVDKTRDDLGLHKSLDWCAETVEYEIQHADIAEEAKTVTSISCTQMQGKMAKSPYWYEPEDDMKPGDVIFYNWYHDYDPAGNLDHVGIIVDVNDTYITVVEGNTEGRENWRPVRKKIRYRCNLNFNCAYPDYYMRYKAPDTEEPKETPEVVEEKSDVAYGITASNLTKEQKDKIEKFCTDLGVTIDVIETKIEKTTKKTVPEIAAEVIRGLWGSGNERKNKLVAAGYDYDEVQKEVNKLL